MSAADRHAERRPNPDQTMLDTPGMAQPPAGYVAQRVAAAVNAANLDERDYGMGALAVALARAVDMAASRFDAYAVATAGRELRETLTRLQLDPASRGNLTENDGFTELIKSLNTPTPGLTP